MLRIALLLLLSLVGRSTALAVVYITNLSGTVFHYATMDYAQPAANTGQVFGWTIKGWSPIEPGATARLKPGWIYIESNGQGVNYDQLQSSTSIAKDGLWKGDFIPVGGEQSTMEKKLKQGYKIAKYYKFNDGFYNTGGDSYKIESRKISIYDSKRELSVGLQPAYMAGRVVYASFDGTTLNATYQINYDPNNDTHVSLSWILTGGRRRFPTSGREEGEIEGTFTVWFTVPK